MNGPPDAARERMLQRVLTGLLVTLCVAGLGWGAWRSSRSRPSLEEAIALADAGRLDEAEAKVLARLAGDPDDSGSHLLCAQITLKRPDPASEPADRRPSPWGQAALDHLDRVRPRGADMSVLLQICRGNALNRVMRFDEAEAAWLEALKINPAAPEAGWNLLNLYYVQGRQDDARRLALQLYRYEPDAHDRALLLVELLRPDARPPAPGSIIKLFEPSERYCPGEFHTALVLGLARTRANQVEDGINGLRRLVRTHPDRVEAWDGLMTALDESGQVDLLEVELGAMPSAVSESPRMLKHKARVAQAADRWIDAVDLYRRARSAEPHNRVVEYRLSRALRHIDKATEAFWIEQGLHRWDSAVLDVRRLYDQITAAPDLGLGSHPEIYQRIADARERMHLAEEAAAWHRLILGVDPTNEVSLAAVARLEGAGRSH
jgi:tetratricopeptide (TPR) repeat protein